MRLGFPNPIHCLAALFALAGPALAAEPAPHSLDLTALDRSVAPCDDFYHFACGGWIAAHPNPPEYPRFGRFDALDLQNRNRLHEILEQAATHPNLANAKVGDFYAACMDEAGIEAKGLAPLAQARAEIMALGDKKQLAPLLARLQSGGVEALFSFGVRTDAQDATRNIANIGQGGLGLPDREYYFKTDAKSQEQRTAYQAHIAKMFELLGHEPTAAAGEAQAVLTIETALAKNALNRVQRRDPHALDHKLPRAELALYAPDFTWDRYFTSVAAPHFDRLNISEPDYIKGIETILAETPLADLKSYLTWHLVLAAAPALPQKFVDENFNFYGRVLQGTTALLPRWQRCVNATDQALGEALGPLYVEAAFSAESKARVQQLVKDLRVAYAEGIAALPWMGPETQRRALGKLDAIIDKIGYPKKWRDYSGLAISREDYLGDRQRAYAFERKRQLAKIGTPFDRLEWGMTPPTVNASYSQNANTINFPAGILQPPFFDPTKDDAVNYGAIGAVIGHEISHGFDDQGRKFDQAGNLKDWWTKDDAAKFETRVACLSDQAGSFTVVDDVKQNGALTLGENTADNGGIRMAYRALQIRLKGKTPPAIDGFSAEQRFFLGFAQVWCSSATPEALRYRALNDPHPAAQFRANGVLANQPEFAKAFNCPAGSPMVRENACRVW